MTFWWCIGAVLVSGAVLAGSWCVQRFAGRFCLRRDAERREKYLNSVLWMLFSGTEECAHCPEAMSSRDRRLIAEDIADLVDSTYGLDPAPLRRIVERQRLDVFLLRRIRRNGGYRRAYYLHLLSRMPVDEKTVRAVERYTHSRNRYVRFCALSVQMMADMCTAPQKLDTFGVFFMKYNYEIRLKAVKLVLEGGLSVREAGCHLGCGRSQVHLWVTLFERHGLAGLKLRHGSYSAEFKLSVLKHMHQNHLSLLETAVHFGIPGPFVIRQWERLYQNQGAEGLRRKPQRRRPAMSKSKTKKVKLKTTPHEELLKELEYLRAENAYLKKLQALVEERIVRESGKEPKPSKD